MKLLSAAFPGLEVYASEENYQAAQSAFRGYVNRNPRDRFSKSNEFIIQLIASDFERNGVKDPRSLIGCMVEVGGKGWTSY